jgi:hypothetical protein
MEGAYTQMKAIKDKIRTYLRNWIVIDGDDQSTAMRYFEYSGNRVAWEEGNYRYTAVIVNRIMRYEFFIDSPHPRIATKLAIHLKPQNIEQTLTSSADMMLENLRNQLAFN